MTSLQSPTRLLINYWTSEIKKIEIMNSSCDEIQDVKDEFEYSFLTTRTSLTTFDPELAEIENLERRLNAL